MPNPIAGPIAARIAARKALAIDPTHRHDRPGVPEWIARAYDPTATMHPAGRIAHASTVR